MIIQKYVRLSVCPSDRLSVRPSVRLSVRPSVRPTVCPSDRLSVWPSVRPTVCPTVCPSDRLSVRPYSSSFTLVQSCNFDPTRSRVNFFSPKLIYYLAIKIWSSRTVKIFYPHYQKSSTYYSYNLNVKIYNNRGARQLTGDEQKK